MGASSPLTRSRLIAVIAAVAALAALILYRNRGPAAAEGAPSRELTSGASSLGSAPLLSPSAPAVSPPLAAAAASEAASVSKPPGEIEPPGHKGGDYPVDLEALRAKMPNNLYFVLGAPTDDPVALERRAGEEHRFSDLFGKVQSNTATVEEIHQYYDHRQKLSEDYIEFAATVLSDYKDKLPERDKGLYELSINMHKTRLAEIPRQTEDALARREAYDKRKEEWLRSGKSTPPPPNP